MIHWHLDTTVLTSLDDRWIVPRGAWSNIIVAFMFFLKCHDGTFFTGITVDLGKCLEKIQGAVSGVRGIKDIIYSKH